MSTGMNTGKQARPVDATAGTAPLVITLVGRDRPGLIDRVASVAADAGADWLESHLANLVGQFAGIVHLDVPVGRRAALREALQALGGDGLAVTVVEPELPAVDAAGAPDAEWVSLSVTGHDHPGIVRDIAHALAELGVSIDSLETRREHASMSGESLFHADAVLRVPKDCSLDEVERIIEALSGEIMVDAQFGAAHQGR